MNLFVKDSRVPFAWRGNNGPFNEHYHYEFEYWHMIEGTAKVRVENEVFDISDGQVFLAFPFVRHEYICEKPNISTVGIFSPSDIPDFTDILLGCRPEYPVIDTKDMYPGFGEALERFDGYFMSNRAEKKTAFLMLSAIVGEMISCVMLKKKADVPNDTMERLVSLCLSNYMEPSFNLETVSAELGYNRSYISRLLNRGMGVGFTKFLSSIRIDKSYALLRRTDMPITTIALECGFGSVRNFNRIFSDFAGLTPSDFRRRWCGNDYYDYYKNKF